MRNEAHLIAETLDHHAAFCDAGIYVYDDCSTDDTADICRRHPAVIDVVQGEHWNPVRVEAEHENRQALLERALLDDPEWLLYFDADERVEVDLQEVPWSTCDAVRMKLFDFYITEEDVDSHYSERRWLGPEYRRIIMLYRNMPGMGYDQPDQRETNLPPNARIVEVGWVRHYGKAVSVEEWENTCRYYAEHFPEPYRTKWRSRMGRAVHTESDFGRELIEWDDRDRLGVELFDVGQTDRPNPDPLGAWEMRPGVRLGFVRSPLLRVLLPFSRSQQELDGRLNASLAALSAEVTGLRATVARLEHETQLSPQGFPDRVPAPRRRRSGASERVSPHSPGG